MRRILTFLTILTVWVSASCTASPDFSGVVAVRSAHGYGSGVVLGHDDSGYIVATVAHVVRNDRWPLIDQHLGEVVALDRSVDVAIVRVPDRGQGYRVRKLAEPRLGQPVTALGWTFAGNGAGLICYRGHIITNDWLMIPGTAAANCGAFPGMSGGPVIDRWGTCLGIVRGCQRAGPMVVLDSTTIIAPSREIRRLMENV